MIATDRFDWTQVVFLLGGVTGIVGGVIAFVRFLRRTSSGTFTIEAAKGVTVMQNQFIQTLQDDYNRLSKENHELSGRVRALEERNASFSHLNERIEQLVAENAELKQRVEHLEIENRDLRARVEDVTPEPTG